MIRKMTGADRTSVLKMMRTFYSSDAVHTNGSDDIFTSDIDNCISDNPYVYGYIFSDSDNIQGYGMIAVSYSTEFGRQCIWIEDIYVLPEYRGHGIAGSFISYIADKYPHAVLRLEAEAANKSAVKAYKKSGFDVLPYLEMYMQTESMQQKSI